MKKDPACGGSLSTCEAAVVPPPFSLKPEIDLKVLEMFFELVPTLNAVSFAPLVAKKKEKKKRCKEIISFVWICSDLNTDSDSQ